MEDVQQGMQQKDYSGPVNYPVLTKVPGGRLNLDQAIEDVWPRARELDKPIIIRLVAKIRQYDRNYLDWLGVGWNLEFPTPASAVRFREDFTKWVTEWAEARKAEASVEG